MQLLRDLADRAARPRLPLPLQLPPHACNAPLQAPRCMRARRAFHLRNESRKIPMLVEVQVRVARVQEVSFSSVSVHDELSLLRVTGIFL
ncbi:hypothetical protein [Sorangium sp. So ce362]|uniref:hypothetical protein n=1 Tax=Sorangium sp. So ce362 TaxID=3133303 RepID=UPI003F5D92DC